MADKVIMPSPERFVHVALLLYHSIAPPQASVIQLLPGGIEANFWDNEGLLGAPVVRRVDPEVRWWWWW